MDIRVNSETGSGRENGQMGGQSRGFDSALGSTITQSNQNGGQTTRAARIFKSIDRKVNDTATEITSESYCMKNNLLE